MLQQQHITANNSAQNVQGTVNYDRTNELGNLSIENPTIEQMNTAMTGGSPSAIAKPVQADDRLFGNHIREAVAIVKDWVRE